jgi:hypothetical protein
MGKTTRSEAVYRLGRCRACGWVGRLTREGSVYPHGDRARPCRGAGQTPAKGSVTTAVAGTTRG